MRTVDVVVGIIFKGNKFLAEKRKLRIRRDPGITCLPGGHVESNETKRHALIREMNEELGIKVKKLKFVKKDFWTASNGERQIVYYYLILDYTGKPVCKTAKKLIWTENAKDLDIEDDRKVVEKMIKCQKK